jgi:LuxR family transcriptional regulator, maltose regulon positive regulatory protein
MISEMWSHEPLLSASSRLSAVSQPEDQRRYDERPPVQHPRARPLTPDPLAATDSAAGGESRGVAPPTLSLLVPTKVTAPQPLVDWVVRERLIAQLDERPGAKLTLVVAPAGFGKTTLVSQWLGNTARHERAVGEPLHRPGTPALRVAWLTLDAYDQDGLRLLAYVAGAIERALPGALPTTLPLLTGAEPAPLHTLLPALLVDLNAIPNGITVVLDDYHTITAEAIHQLVAYLLRHLPAGCRFVVISRIDPPLSLARLRAEGQLSMLRAADLRFTEAETHVFAQRLTRQTLEPSAISALHQQTEGWALALRLALVEHAGTASSTQFPASARYTIGEYLAGEVLAQQPIATQETLLALAVPERFCAGLCAALLGTPHDLPEAERRLDDLVNANLLVEPLDDEWRWFRFHHLFRDLLLRRLRHTAGHAEVRTLQLRAAAWFGDALLIEEAVQLYLAAGDEDAAAGLIERHMAPALGRQSSTASPTTWLRLLPPALIARRPGLALIEARIANARADVPALAASLARVDVLLAAPENTAAPLPWPSFEGDRLVLQGILASWEERFPEALAALQAAMERPVTPVLSVAALSHVGMAMVAEGRYAEGATLLPQLFQPPSPDARGVALASQYAGLCQMHMHEGNFVALERDARQLAQTVAAYQLGETWRCYADAFIGRAAYERSDLATAATALYEIVTRKYRINTALFANCLVGLARIAALHGDSAGVARYEHEMRAFAHEVGSGALNDQMRGCAAWLALTAGNLPGALRVAQDSRPDRLLIIYCFEAPQLAYACALIAAGGRGRLAEAETLVADCLAKAERLHLTRQLVIALAVQALLRQAQGLRSEALTLLGRAVALAAPRKLGRALLDLGPALRPLLQTLADRGTARPFLEPLLLQFERQPGAGFRQPAITYEEPLPEMLTRRETEVLALLAERWSNHEIAEQLGIATNTARKHTSTIYDKLGVRSRREAVAAARAFGLLPPE